MNLFPIFQWLQATDWGTALRESSYAYPIVMTTHLSGMALFGGMILMVDMRLLGLALKGHSVTDIVKGLRPWKRVGFLLTATCGFLLFGSEAEKYYPNPYFQIKMTILFLIAVHALVFRNSVYNNTEEFDRRGEVPGRAKLAAVLSVILWVGMVSAGRWIGYYEGPREKGQVVSTGNVQVARASAIK